MNIKRQLWATAFGLGSALLLAGCGVTSHSETATPAHHATKPRHRPTPAHHALTAAPDLMPAGLLNASGSDVPLTVGHNGTAVLFVNPASPLSAYEARWVIPPLLLKGMDYAVVMALPSKTVATPGPEKPANSGKAGQATASETSQALGALAPDLVKTWHLPKGTQVYTVTPATVQQWHLTGFPTLWVVNSQNQVVAQLPGALSLSSAKSILSTIEGGV